MSCPDVNNIQYQMDLEFGHTEENRVKSILENYFGNLNTLDKYNPFDFENENYLIELKSRRIPHNQYDTAMVNYSKLLKTSKEKRDRYIIFNYSDGLFYWRVNNADYTIGKGGRNDRGILETYIMAYVPKEKLIPIDNIKAELM